VAVARMKTPLEPGESLVGTWVAGIPTSGGRAVKYGGTLILTSRRLIWEPVNLPAVLRLAAGLRFLDGLTRGLPLRQIDMVRPDLDRPALLHIDALGETTTFGIAASRMAPVWSRRNWEARDAAAASILRAMATRSI
jgi:hypothetical protein